MADAHVNIAELARAKEYAERTLEGIQEQDPEYFAKLTSDYGLTADKVATMAQELYEQHAKQVKKKYADFDDFLKQHFSSQNPDKEPLENYINYLLNKQKYEVISGRAGQGVEPIGIVSKILGIYRHAVIRLKDSPFANDPAKKHEILELNPAAQTDVDTITDESKAIKRDGKVISHDTREREAPGFVNLALHTAGTSLLETGEYNLSNYRPWENDCQTYLAHAQAKADDLLRELPSFKEHKPPPLDKVGIHSFVPSTEGQIKNFEKRLRQKVEAWCKQEGRPYNKDDYKIEYDWNDMGFNIKIMDKDGKMLFDLEDNFRNLNRARSRSLGGEKTPFFSDYLPWLFQQFGRSIAERTNLTETFAKAKELGSKISEPIQQCLGKVFNAGSTILRTHDSVQLDVMRVVSNLIDSTVGTSKQIEPLKRQLAVLSKKRDQINESINGLQEQLVSLGQSKDEPSDTVVNGIVEKLENQQELGQAIASKIDEIGKEITKIDSSSNAKMYKAAAENVVKSVGLISSAVMEAVPAVKLAAKASQVLGKGLKSAFGGLFGSKKKEKAEAPSPSAGPDKDSRIDLKGKG